MKRNFFIMSVLFVCLNSFGQQAKIDIAKDKCLSASNYVAYPGPLQQKLTAAPAGYAPFYISHYGRHGSRYLIGTGDYDKPYRIMQHADSLGKLTPKGHEVLEKIRMIREEAMGRDGELTQLGAEQHKGIAKRMYERFPQVFEGKTNIDAKSTVIIRCILSMENALQQLLVLNPQLCIRHDASYHDMYYMNLDDNHLNKQKITPEAKKALDEFDARHTHPDRVMSELFNDENYWRDSVKYNNLYEKLFKLASNVQSTELRHKLSLYDIFSDDEIYDNWLMNNAYWYIAYGPSPLNGGTQPFSQRNLLRKIISEADSCMAFPHPGATLRYGHEVDVMPLACLLELNNCGKQIADLEQLDDEGWNNYRIFPMGCNIQFIFYRKSAADKDVIFKVLLNENETTLPLPSSIAPYYHWSDFKAFYLNKLDSYKE
jgi:hypothetical protein